MSTNLIAHESPTTPTRDWSLERWIGASAAGHAFLFAFAMLAPPPVAAIVLDGDGGWPSARVLAPIALAPSATTRAPDKTAAHSGTSQATREAPGPAHAHRRSRHVVRGAQSDDPRRVLDVIRHGLASASTASDSPYALTQPSRPGVSMAAMLGSLLDGDGLDMVGTGRGAGGHAGAPLGGGTGIGTTCGDDEIAIAVVAHGTRTVGCTAGSLGHGNGTGAGTSQRREPEHVWHLRCGVAVRIPCAVPSAIVTSNLGATGELSREAVRRVVVRGRAAIRGCYQQALVARPDLSGRVTVQWLVSPSGRVSSAAIDAAATDLHAADVESCIVSAVSRWSFPESDGPTAVTFPFVLDVAE